MRICERVQVWTFDKVDVKSILFDDFVTENFKSLLPTKKGMIPLKTKHTALIK